MNCHGFQAVVSDRKTPSEAACRRQDLSRVSHAPGLCWRCGTPRSASLHVGLNACHRLRRFSLAKPKSLPKPLRPLRPSLCDPCVFCFSKFTLLLFALFTLIKTQRTRRHSQSSQRRYREILPLCVLRGLHSATFAFLADPRRNVFSLSAVALTQRPQRCFAKIAKTLSRKPSTLRPLRASLCDLCVFCQSNSRYSSFHSKHWL